MGSGQSDCKGRVTLPRKLGGVTLGSGPHFLTPHPTAGLCRPTSHCAELWDLQGGGRPSPPPTRLLRCPACLLVLLVLLVQATAWARTVDAGLGVCPNHISAPEATFLLIKTESREELAHGL